MVLQILQQTYLIGDDDTVYLHDGSIFISNISYTGLRTRSRDGVRGFNFGTVELAIDRVNYKE